MWNRRKYGIREDEKDGKMEEEEEEEIKKGR